MSEKKVSCASCAHLSINGKYCYNWQRVAETYDCICPQYVKETPKKRTTTH